MRMIRLGSKHLEGRLERGETLGGLFGKARPQTTIRAAPGQFSFYLQIHDLEFLAQNLPGPKLIRFLTAQSKLK